MTDSQIAKSSLCMTSNTLQIKDAIYEANMEDPSVYEEVSIMDSRKSIN